ncbi:MAG: hypothetical protein ACKVPJ_13440 [Chitinophagales bacterium]
MVRNYEDKELIDRVKSLPSFIYMPKYLLIGVRSREDVFNQFDDKFYLFIESTFKVTTSGTTNPGSKSLLGGWLNTNGKGSAIIKADEIYYDVYRHGLHKGRMEALRQVGNMKYYRDDNNNELSEEIGEVTEGNYFTNFHFNSYDLVTNIKKYFINGWSEGCQVANQLDKYKTILALTYNHVVSYALLKEF